MLKNKGVTDSTPQGITQVNQLLDGLFGKTDDTHRWQVLEIGWNQNAAVDVMRTRLCAQTGHYVIAAASLREQVMGRRACPELEWQTLNLADYLSCQRMAAKDFQLVFAPDSPPADREKLLTLVSPGGHLLSGSGDNWSLTTKTQDTDTLSDSQPFPLTDIQHAYWIGRGQALTLGGVSCHVYFEWCIDDFSLPRFERAWNQLIQRHDMMRAVIDEDGRQRILAVTPWYTIATEDWCTLAQEQRAILRHAIREQMCHQVLDASCWPLFDLRASQETATGWRIHLDLDLLMFDVQSFHILLAELERLYHYPDTSLPALHYSFRTYQLAREEERQGADYTADRNWWLARLDQLAPPPALPLRCQPAEAGHPVFRRLQQRLFPEAWQGLSRLASEHGLTPSAVLLAVFSEVLAFWASDARFTLNLTQFNRRPHHEDVHKLVGDFTAVLLLTPDCRQIKSFAERASDIQSQLWTRLSHSRFGGVEVLRELGRRAGSVQGTLMPVVFTSLLGMDLDVLVRGADLLGEPDFLYTATPQVWLDSQAMLRNGSLEYNWIVIDNLFPAGMIDAMFACYGQLLERLAHDAPCWQHPLSLSLPCTQLKIRQAVNATLQPYTPELLHTAFFHRAKQQNDADAIVTASERISYRALADQALRIAAALNAACTPIEGKPVLLVLPKSPLQIAAALGILSAAGVLVPLSADWPRARLQDVVDRVHPAAMIAPGALCQHFPALITLDFAVTGLPDSGLDAPRCPCPNSTAYVIFTSGSTGKPKGVMMSHAAAMNTVSDVSRRIALGPDDRLLGLSALSFDLAIFDVFATLGAGATLVLPDADGTRDASHWLSLLQRHEITLWNSVPALMAILLEQAQADAVRLDSLRYVLLSGDWIDCNLPAQLKKIAPATQLAALGGATEAAIWSNWFDVDNVEPEWRSIPYGFPLANQYYRILDLHGRERPDFAAGELYIGGTGLAEGYWQDSAQTQASFIVHPSSMERLYRTGDRARYWSNGCIEFLGRIDTQVKLGGHRIELSEIEQAMLRLPYIRDVAVQMRETFGGTSQLVASVVVTTPAPRSQQDTKQLAALQHAGQKAASRLPETRRLHALQHFQTLSEALAPDLILMQLWQLGFPLTEAGCWSPEHYCDRLGIATCFRQLIQRWHAILAEDGQLTITPDGYRATGQLATYAILKTRIHDGQQQLMASLQWVDDEKTFADWLLATPKTLAQVLREPQLAASLLFPAGESQASESLYQRNIVADWLGHLAATLLRTHLSDYGAHQAQVLEIGAGVGGLSISTLPVLAELSPDGLYHYTDVSPWFASHGEARFGQFSVLRTGRYDINQTAQEQNWPQGSMDAVLAANVLHNAHQLVASLRDIRQLLRPGGMLILLEATRDKRLQWITAAAVLEHAAQGSEKAAESRLLSEAQWRTALWDAGFSDICSWPEPGSPLAFVGQQLIMARRPGIPEQLLPSALQHALSAMIPAYMIPTQFFYPERLPLNSNGKVDRSRLSVACYTEQDAQPQHAAPLPGTETELAGLWCELLRLPRVGRHQDFFAAGGDSLLATRLCAQLSALRNQSIPVRLLFTCPQLSALAAALDELKTSDRHSPLVSLNTALDTALICIHGSDGSVAPYRPLAQRLESSVHCLALQSSGLEPGQPIIGTAGDQADYYFDALRHAGIHGPWSLLGWSMGTRVAMEMALRLYQAGEEIALLALVDPVPQAAMTACASSEFALLSSLANPSLQQQATAAGLNAINFASLAQDERLHWWRRVLPSLALISDAALMRRIAVLQANVNALLKGPLPVLPDTLATVVYVASEHPSHWENSIPTLQAALPASTEISLIEDSTHQDILTQEALLDSLTERLRMK